MSANTISPESFTRTVGNVAAYPVGLETSFGLGATHVEVWRPREYHWVVSAIEVTDDFEIVRLHTVAIVPGEYRAYELVNGNGTVLHGEFNNIKAALSLAFDIVSGEWAP